MSNQWFRMYAEFAHDPKIQMLSETLQRRFVMLLCARCNGDVTLQDSEVTFLLRITETEWLETKAIFIAKNFIDEANNILNWDKRQFRSDSSAARVRKHRETKKQPPVTKRNVTVTPPEQNRTDTEQIQKESSRGSRFTLTQPLNGWIDFCLVQRPDIDPGKTFDSFRDYWIAKPGKDGRKLDWTATWHNWVRNQNSAKGNQHANTGRSNETSFKPSKSERFKQALVDDTLAELGAASGFGGG